MIPGLISPRIGILAAGGGGGASSFTFRDSAVSNGATIAVPAGVQDNDFGILIDLASNTAGGSAPSAVTPTNWTNRLSTTNGDDTRLMVSTKVLTGAEASGSITGMNDSVEEKIMLVFTPASAISTVTFSAFNTQFTGSNPSTQTVSASGQSSPLIVIGFAARADGTTAAFSTASPSFTATVLTGDSDAIAGYKIYAGSPQNHTIDCDVLGTDTVLLSFYARFT